MKKMMLLAAALALGGLALSPVSVMAKGKEKHPEIHRAHKALENAKNDLEKAAHDYDGHRVKALEAVKQALAELDQALEVVKNEGKAGGQAAAQK